MKHTRVVSTKCTPGFACRAFSDTTLVCFIVNEHTTKCSRYRNARDCVTGLHDRRSRECNPVTSVECISLSFRTPPCVLAFITYILGRTELRCLLFIEFDTTKLHIFQIRNLFHCVAESWWNMPFKGTRHGDGVMHGAVAMLLRLWKHAATLWHHAAWIRIVTSHNAWMGYEYSLSKHESPKGDW